MNTIGWVERAYKKLKASVYFDKTQLPLVDKIVAFEQGNLEQELRDAATALDSGGDIWRDFTDDILEKLEVLVFPKKVKEEEDEQVIFNRNDDRVVMEKAQYFIDLPVQGQILGVLWVLTIGACLDDQRDPDNMMMYEHSYGNRLHKKLFHEETGEVTFSPHLFHPYFSQYENWRDTALRYAKERLDSKQDALILTLDLRSFFYSVHLSKGYFDSIYRLVSDKKLPRWAKRVHAFIYEVCKRYSDRVRKINRDRELNLGKRVFLPIGFLPSNILSNWFLTPFDKAICDSINPVYYGRYVDDIIIVDKVEKNSVLREKAQTRGTNGKRLTALDVIQHYFLSRRVPTERAAIPIFKRVPIKEMTPQQKKDYICLNEENRGGTRDQTQKGAGPSGKQDNYDEKKSVFRINNAILKAEKGNIKPDIQVQNDKVKIFYFQEGSTRALLDCFRKEIGRNASEFRLLPDMEHILGKNDYSDVFRLYNKETPHKLRGVSKVELDKFFMSMFLGKYRKASRMIHDKREKAFIDDLLTFLDRRQLIRNYTLWERILEITVVNDCLDVFEKVVRSIITTILDLSSIVVDETGGISKKSLFFVLRVGVCKTLALCWGEKTNQLIGRIAALVTNKVPFKEIVQLFEFHGMTKQRIAYCEARMVNKYALALPIGLLSLKAASQTTKHFNLCQYKDFAALMAESNERGSFCKYFPYSITPQEISFALVSSETIFGREIPRPEDREHLVNDLFWKLNYPGTDAREVVDQRQVDTLPLHFNGERDRRAYITSVSSRNPDKIKIAIGNTRLLEKDVENALQGKPNRGLERYQQVQKLLRDAVKEKSDLLVLPECFLPWEWISEISRFAANNDLAIVSGIEHIVSHTPEECQDRPVVYNLTAVILPYQDHQEKYSQVYLHHKVHYSPDERNNIEGYSLSVREGNNYQMFCWRGMWFSVYCCYEMTSIEDRSLFGSYADLVVASEWNRDVNYFSSIVESLCRDLHCYCVQVNSSNYGDSRVVAPLKTEERDLVKTKGGLNSTILTTEINIKKLREHQRKEILLQQKDRTFKPTPPRFDREAVKRKQDGTLYGYLAARYAGKGTQDELTLPDDDVIQWLDSISPNQKKPDKDSSN